MNHSDGYLLQGTGGWQNCLLSKTVILPLSLFRDRIGVITDRITKVCGPGEMIDVIAAIKWVEGTVMDAGTKLSK
ncbi:MAG: hypothetical protein KGY60_06345 [Bacteroidales bacterium]|nr:hypothetical protein [Bacteroidales bacterium]